MCHGQMINSALLKARKQHRCSECRKVIRPGQLYERQAMADDGSVYSFKLCRRCLYALEVSYGDIYDDEVCLYPEAVEIWKRDYVECGKNGWRGLLALLRIGRERFKAKLDAKEGSDGQ